MLERFDPIVRLSPCEQPTLEGALNPGDLGTFMPQGSGLDVPLVAYPWAGPEGLGQRASYFEYQAPVPDPIKNAPLTDEAGGVVYFPDEPEDADLASLLRLLGVRTRESRYAVFARQSEDPQEDGYLTQFRITSRFALLHGFHAIRAEEYESFPEQSLTIGELVPAFVRAEHEHWGGGWPQSERLEGCMGGDGDWAREALAFGFLVENAYQGVYRLWSRAWLVTK
jgi:hypothetical protein